MNTVLDFCQKKKTVTLKNNFKKNEIINCFNVHHTESELKTTTRIKIVL